MAASRTQSRPLRFQRIMIYDAANVGTEMGFLEMHRGILAGSRENHEFWIILDRSVKPVGMVSHDGHFYRFDESGRRQEVAVDALDRGLIKFFDAEPGSRVELPDVDPYRE